MSLKRIHKVLSTLTSNQVQHLLMGGQACVLYGAAEFSRDTDVVVLAEPDNLARLARAVAELEGELIAVPTFEREYLQRGHACHFRCHHPDAAEMRLDVMAVLRNVDPFADLWDRRATVAISPDLIVELISISDLVCAKKTQRDKDWHMLRRLIEAHYTEFRNDATAEQVRFWLCESRTPSMLLALAQRHPRESSDLVAVRPLLSHAIERAEQQLDDALEVEERRERELDRAYWRPLRLELEQLRHARISGNATRAQNPLQP